MQISTLVIVFGTSLGLLLAAQVWLLWRLTRMAGTTLRLEEKLTHFADALSLLTETSEAGFRAIADEMTRRQATDGPAPARPRPSVARLKAAAKRGTSIAEIAAAESMSEGEVRLRLHLAEQAAPTRSGARAGKAAAGKGEGDALRA